MFNSQPPLPICFLLVVMTGCGGNDDFNLGQVTGTVTCEGEVVTEGTIAFTPVATGDKTMIGKPASSRIESDGSFQLTTYVQHDGAVIGKHRVTVTFPGEELGAIPGGEDGENEEIMGGLDGRSRGGSNVKLPPCAGSEKKIEVDVVAGENTFKIELDD